MKLVLWITLLNKMRKVWWTIKERFEAQQRAEAHLLRKIDHYHGNTTQISWRAEIFLLIQEPNLICFNPFKGCFYQRKRPNEHNFGFRGLCWASLIYMITLKTKHFVSSQTACMELLCFIVTDIPFIQQDKTQRRPITACKTIW